MTRLRVRRPGVRFLDGQGIFVFLKNDQTGFATQTASYSLAKQSPLTWAKVSGASSAEFKEERYSISGSPPWGRQDHIYFILPSLQSELL